MAHIIALAGRAACALAGLLLATEAWGAVAAIGTTDAFQVADALDSASSLASNYSLSYDPDRWTDEYSVFHLAVAEDLGDVGRGVLGSGFAASDDPRLKPLTRLDSAWTLTSSLSPYPLRIGDGVSSVQLWEQPARMGGVQFGTFQPTPPDVVVPPSLIATPYEAASPGGPTPTRFMDQLSSALPLSPPATTAWGRSDFSFEAGRLRENFELRSNNYGPWVTSGTYRYGVGPATTVDGQVAQLAHQQSFLGIGVLEGLGPKGSVSARVGGSRDADATGWTALLRADFSHDGLRLAVRSSVQSPGFQEVGDSATLESLKQRTIASAGLDMGSLGHVAVAGVTQTYTDDTRRDIVALSHSMRFGFGGIISTAAAYSPGQLGNSALTLSFTYPFDYVGAAHRPLDHAVNTAMNHTLVDAFGQSHVPSYGKITVDRPGQPLIAPFTTP